MAPLLPFLLLVASCQLPREWVVKEVFPPIPRYPASESELIYGAAVVTGDVDGDSCCDVILTARSVDWGMFLADHLFLGWGPLLGNSFVYSQGTWKLAVNETPPYQAALRSPLGPLLAAVSYRHGNALSTWDRNSPFQPVAVGLPIAPAAFTRGDDVNGDGYEEVFTQNYWPWTLERYSELRDGQTLSLLWERRDPIMSHHALVLRQEPESLPDLDGDGTGDYIAFWADYDPQLPTWWEHDIQALSGRDGALIWENREQTGGSALWFPVSGKDFTGDGVADLGISNYALMKAVDGRTGATIWWFDPRIVFAPLVPPGANYFGMIDLALLTPTPAGKGIELCGVIDFSCPGPWTTFEAQIVHLDAATGTLLEMLEFPADLMPWHPDVLQGPQSAFGAGSAMGDVDRDGLQEIGWRAPAPGFELPGQNGATPYHLVTLGLKTLFVPSQAQVGATIQAEVSIPSAPDHEFYVLVSRSFDRRGGLFLDGWKTHLGPDPWLTWSQSTRALAGRLDAQGRGSVAIPVPASPALAGQRVYSKAVALEPGTTDEVWTLSTLGQTLLVPCHPQRAAGGYGGLPRASAAARRKLSGAMAG